MQRALVRLLLLVLFDQRRVMLANGFLSSAGRQPSAVLCTRNRARSYAQLRLQWPAHTQPELQTDSLFGGHGACDWDLVGVKANAKSSISKVPARMAGHPRRRRLTAPGGRERRRCGRRRPSAATTAWMAGDLARCSPGTWSCRVPDASLNNRL